MSVCECVSVGSSNDGFLTAFDSDSIYYNTVLLWHAFTVITAIQSPSVGRSSLLAIKTHYHITKTLMLINSFSPQGKSKPF